MINFTPWRNVLCVYFLLRNTKTTFRILTVRLSIRLNNHFPQLHKTEITSKKPFNRHLRSSKAQHPHRHTQPHTHAFDDMEKCFGMDYRCIQCSHNGLPSVRVRRVAAQRTDTCAPRLGPPCPYGLFRTAHVVRWMDVVICRDVKVMGALIRSSSFDCSIFCLIQIKMVLASYLLKFFYSGKKCRFFSESARTFGTNQIFYSIVLYKLSLV